MLSLASLLNPAPPGPPINRFPPSPASSSSPTASIPDEPDLLGQHVMAKQKIPKSAALLPTSRPKGVVNFPPFENLDEASLRQVRQFRVCPFGNIQGQSRHIPYNSTKKGFFEKTGRESFEVFQYTFKVPGDETEYTVMWDYNVGLVRMTPFFKCCKYPKTTPAKMLNLNPGLKEITHSITGGSIMAQGYWMPYYSAKAVCATFCHNIAGALIPIFGPDFPSHCTPSEAPEYSRMTIDPAIVLQSTREAEHFRMLCSINSAAAAANASNSNNNNNNHHHAHYRRRPVPKALPTPNSPYATDPDSDTSPIAAEHAHRPRYPFSPVQLPPPPTIAAAAASSLQPTSSGWTPANVVSPHRHQHQHQHYEPSGLSPWLTAVPRFTTETHIRPYPAPLSAPLPAAPLVPPTPSSHPWRGKRAAEHVTETDYSPQQQRIITSNISSGRTAAEPVHQDPRNGSSRSNSNSSSSKIKRLPPSDSPLGAAGGRADKNAALLLMNLSVRDSRGGGGGGTRSGGYGGGSTTAATTTVSGTSSPGDGAFPRVKRVRSNSM
ncbi:uncharacterized protein F4812DRAFT_116012 [Daldinia caldariorum]|uniref:uncharacterized protein n=1 Tax=Daldinia caldariorum TaxID=326644 RepID=UPI0020072CBF|nr:uncharacterized protein F4812DRAFT_116012 [Daldinia caldariorum]KAI1465890.1 hypothetical protein F4812DRAFT_116012 [Daldinia caldariorum]